MIGNTNIQTKNILLRPYNDLVYSDFYKVDGVAQDVTNFAGFMQFRRYPGLNQLIFQASTVNGMISFGTVDGLFNIHIPYSSTAEMLRFFDTCYYDLVFVDTSAKRFTYLQGKVFIDKNAVTNIADKSTALI